MLLRAKVGLHAFWLDGNRVTGPSMPLEITLGGEAIVGVAAVGDRAFVGSFMLVYVFPRGRELVVYEKIVVW